MTTLQQLDAEQRKSPWLDNPTRGHLPNGRLRDLLDEGIRGVTRTTGCSDRPDATYGGGMAGSMVDEIQALRTRGYVADFSVTPDGQLRSDTCGHTHRPNDAVIESTARFEGASNPDDQAVVYGLYCDACRVRGVLVAAYGPTATAAEAAVLTALSPRVWGDN